MDWKNKTLLAYGLGGLILGVCAGIITINNELTISDNQCTFLQTNQYAED